MVMPHLSPAALDIFRFPWYDRSVMGKITDIKIQKRAKSRVNVYVDGEFAVALEAVTAKAGGLEVGAEVSRGRLEELAAESEAESALRRAFAYVGRRMRTEAEVRRYLADKGYSARITDDVTEKLKSYGYIDDGEFVRSYVESKSGSRGKLRLRRDLEMLGADGKTVEEVLGELGDQREAAARAAEKYLRSHEYDYGKLFMYLRSRGFESEDIRAAIRSVGAGEEDDEGSV